MKSIQTQAVITGIRSKVDRSLRQRGQARGLELSYSFTGSSQEKKGLLKIFTDNIWKN